jgi:putative transposase
LSSLCTLLGYTRQAFYGQQKQREQQLLQSELIVQQVQKHRQLQPRLGVRKLLLLLQDFVREHHIKLGRDALFDLLREQGLLVRKRRKGARTTFSRHRYKKYPNLTKGHVATAPNQLWVSDITYIAVKDGFAYLSLITDNYSKKIAGFYLSKTLEATGCVNALRMALDSLAVNCRPVHHSDRGVQYCSQSYVELLHSRHLQISMTENGDPRENAVAERVNGILKDELLQQWYPDFKTAQTEVAKAVCIYNTLRPHSSCNMMTPVTAHLQTGELKKHWKNYYKKKEVNMAAP